MAEQFSSQFHSCDPREASRRLGSIRSQIAIKALPGPAFGLDSDVAVLAGMRMMRLSFASAVEIEVQAPFDGFVLCLPVAARVLKRVGGRGVVELDLGAGAALDAIAIDGWTLPAPLTLETLAIDHGRISTFLADLLDRPAEARLVVEPVEGTSQLAGTLSALFQAIHVGLRGHAPLLRHGLAIKNIEEALLTLILNGLRHNYSGDLHGRAAPGASWQVRRAIDFMQANLGRPMTATEIAAAAGIGLRSLQISFQKQTGVAPMAYLRNLRLAQARLDLRHDPATIAEIAYRWGFSSPQQFSTDYRNAFGELPNETQRRRPR